MNTGIGHAQLNKFVGSWHTTGKIPATETQPEIQVAGTDTYEWLPGNFFLLHKAAVLIGNDTSETFEIIGADNTTNVVTMRYYNNKGETGSMTATCVHEVWTFSDDTLRFTGGFKNQDQEFSGIWEQLGDDGTWRLFMEIKLIKAA